MPNPLESYRRTQRELRQSFEAFTKENCPTCPTPCCRRPARILPTDIQLAESVGWRGRVAALETATPPAVTQEASDVEAETESPPCEYLGERGCTFPDDLRPYGCTAYICQYMYARLDRKTLARIKRLNRDLADKHTILLRTLRPVRWKDE